jgi:2-alkyl-3-oxoalkanoate reductase
MKIFLTGATGVIGGRALPLLIQAGHTVTAAGRSPEKRRALERAGAHGVDVDILDAGSVRRAIAGHDAIVNLATHMPSSAKKMMLPWAWRENDRIRRIGSATIVQAALSEGIRRIVQESFAPIYIDRGDEWIDEATPVRPAPYNRSTLDAERSIERFNDSGGIGVVLRFAALYGPDDFLREMLDVIRKGWSPLPGSPRAFFTSLAQEDAATAVAAAVTVPAGVYNVAEDDPLRREEWVDTLAEAAGLRRPRAMPAWLTRLGGSTMELLSRSQRISNRKLRGVSGWAPRFARPSQAWKEVLAALSAP